MTQHITLTRDQGIGRVVLDRPTKRNALSLETLSELRSTLEMLAADSATRVVVISGEGTAFSAGHDLSEMIDRDEGFYDALFGECSEVTLGIQAMPQPVIASVDGMATAAGCQLVAASDLAIASDRSRFATPGVTIGLFCSTPMVPIVRAVGRKRAMQMLLTGSAIDAQTALGWGLVNSVVPAERLEAAVTDLANQITRHSRDVIGIGKAAFYRQISQTEADAYGSMGEVMVANAGHPDAQEGMQAFLDKRPPDWPSQA